MTQEEIQLKINKINGELSYLYKTLSNDSNRISKLESDKKELELLIHSQFN